MRNNPTPKIPVCWGASSRDVERNGSRNSQHIDFIFDELQDSNVSNLPFIYQYCGHESKVTKSNLVGQCVTSDKDRSDADKLYACRHITAIIVIFPNKETDAKLSNRAKIIGKALNVPVYGVYHEPFDVNYNHVLDYEVTLPNGENQYNFAVDWRADFLDALLVEQEKHIADAHNCKLPADIHWLDGKNDNAISNEPTKVGSGDDLTVSGILRVIPAVRHLDMDACITCDECDTPLALIEASSDGYSRGKYSSKIKPATMTLKIGAKLDVPSMKLLHDKESFVTEDSGADIFIWKAGKTWDKDGIAIKHDGRTVDMIDVLDELDVMIKPHKHAK